MKQLLFGKWAIILILGSLIFLLGCSEQEPEIVIKNNIRENYLVEKIEVIGHYKAEYFYNDQNKLIKRVIYDQNTHDNNYGNLKAWDEFEYQDGLVSKILYYHNPDVTKPMETRCLYDTNGNLVRTEIMSDERVAVQRNYHIENNRMVSFYGVSGKPFETNVFTYNKRGNVKKLTLKGPRLNNLGEPIPGTYQERDYIYEYDGGLKPNFSIDYLFFYQPIPGMGTSAEFARYLSVNNLTLNKSSSTTWIYTYDENGLPIKMEEYWAHSRLNKPITRVLTYREIK